MTFLGFHSNSTGSMTREYLNSAEIYLSGNSEIFLFMKLRIPETDKQAKVFHNMWELSLFNLTSVKSGSSQ